MTDLAQHATRPRRSLINDPQVRAVVYQALLILIILALAGAGGAEAVLNMRQGAIRLTCGFWNAVSGFDISQTMIPYSNQSTYGQAFWVGLLNTLLVAVLGIILATIIGFVVGIARLSSNWIVAMLGTIYVEVLRNIPPLLVLLVFYTAVL